jgi:hypothetical protein
MYPTAIRHLQSPLRLLLLLWCHSPLRLCLTATHRSSRDSGQRNLQLQACSPAAAHAARTDGRASARRHDTRGEMIKNAAASLLMVRVHLHHLPHAAPAPTYRRHLLPVLACDLPQQCARRRRKRWPTRSAPCAPRCARR